MATFHLFQRVRIVGCYQPARHGHLIGKEATITGWNNLGGWFVDIDGVGHIRKDTGAPHWFVERNLEPLTYNPDAEDLATKEGSPDWTIPLPACVGVGE